MVHNRPKRIIAEDLIKFVVPPSLKRELQTLASARNISLSALLRLIVSDYIKNRK